MKPQFKGIIFDLGKVIFNYSFSNAYEVWSKFTNLTAEEVRNKFKFDIYFELYECGRISTNQFRESVNEKLGAVLNNDDFELGWNSIYLDVYLGTDNLLKLLKENYRIVALTNTNELHKKIWSAKFEPILNNFENVFCSHEIGYRKPDYKTFETVIEYLKIEKKDLLFLDDNIINISSSKQFGINSLLVKNFEQMILELEINGVKTR